MSLVGRKIFLDWGEKTIALEVYKKGFKPPPLDNVRLTRGKIGFIPKVYDIHDIIGELVFRNPQDTGMCHPEGRDISTYLCEGLFTVQDRDENRFG